MPLVSAPAAIAAGAHDPPVKDCTCGVYAKTTPRGAARWAAQYGGGGLQQYIQSSTNPNSAHSTAIPVVGIIQLWGKVLLYTEGYRGEFGYPYHLFIPKHLTPAQEDRWGSSEYVAKQLRASYAVDVEVVDYTPPDPPPGSERNPYGKDVPA